MEQYNLLPRTKDWWCRLFGNLIDYQGKDKLKDEFWWEKIEPKI